MEERFLISEMREKEQVRGRQHERKVCTTISTDKEEASIESRNKVEICLKIDHFCTVK